MYKFISAVLIGFFCHIFILEPAALSANTFKLGSISVSANNRLSDDAIINYARLRPNMTLSSEDLSSAYSKV